MKRKNLKLLAFTCALAFGLPSATLVNAQTINVPVTLSTTSAITLTAGTDMDFGEWLILLGGDDVSNRLVLNPITGAVVASNSGAGTDTTDNSTRVNITPATGAGSITLETPAPSSVNMSVVINDFADADITMTAATFSLNGGTAGAIGAPSAVAATGGVDTLTFGATVTFTDTPPDGAKTASLDLTFAY